jgi:putative transcriptional regulator
MTKHTPKVKLAPAAGRILISQPTLIDNIFTNSVILLAEHDADGSFGVILNKPSDINLSKLTDQHYSYDPIVHFGGPVKVDTLFFIHSRSDIPGSHELPSGLFWGGNPDVVRTLLEVNLITSEEIKFFIGYSGWSPGQLQVEMEQNSWLVLEQNAFNVMKENVEKLWRKTLLSMGEEYAPWVNFPENPNLN